MLVSRDLLCRCLLRFVKSTTYLAADDLHGGGLSLANVRHANKLYYNHRVYGIIFQL